MKKHTYINDLHFEHTAWKRELDFQKGELAFFNKRLEEIIPRYTKKEVLRKAEQLQNKLKVHNEVVDTLLHEIGSHENDLTTFAKSHPIALDHVHFKDHTEFRDKIETQRKLYAELKKEFFRFLTETM